jgi:protein-disulfide isomerase
MMTYRGKDLALNLLVGALTVAAFLTVAQRLRAGQDAQVNQQPTKVADWRSYASSGERVGSSSPTVTVVVFSDYQCPFCRVAENGLRSVREQYPNDVVVVYRHLPLSFHRHAMAAARAAVCAGQQGRFKNIHEALFRLQDSIGIKPWAEYASMAGLPSLDAFAVCMSNTLPISQLVHDSVAAAKLGVRGTPTILVNELEFTGFPGLDTLRKYIDAGRLSHDKR